LAISCPRVTRGVIARERLTDALDVRGERRSPELDLLAFSGYPSVGAL
jgi:hypothetical protein